MYQLHTFKRDDALVNELAPIIAERLKRAIAKKGHATLAVSGGKTPVNLFSALSEQSILWERVTVTLVDERWVDSRHEDANAGLVKEYLLAGNARRATFVSLKAPYDTPYESIETISQRLKPLLPLDVTILGMGTDGHTASFFPKADTLQDAIDPNTDQIVCPITPPDAPHDRITLTLPVILASDYLCLHCVGIEKHRVLTEVFNSVGGSSYPVSTVINHVHKNVDIFYAECA